MRGVATWSLSRRHATTPRSRRIAAANIVYEMLCLFG
jgi:hypothetical protein